MKHIKLFEEFVNETNSVRAINFSQNTPEQIVSALKQVGVNISIALAKNVEIN